MGWDHPFSHPSNHFNDFRLSTTAAPGNEYGTSTWFNWVKTYSALAGCLGFMAIRYIPSLAKKKRILWFPPAILALNILEACIRDFQVFSYGVWEGAYIDHLWVMSGPWNIMNGIAGLLNIVAICGWTGIFVSKDKSKDMIWPDMIWAWIIAYDLWNFAYTYNCIADHSFYCGLALLLSCTIPTFFIKKKCMAPTPCPYPSPLDYVRYDSSSLCRSHCTCTNYP